tara:strand:- start:51682 stop:52995 length:1314 start_codon:yes stop_codon:yes gene_type:complete
MALAAVNGNNRRGKTALFLFFCGWAGIFPHWINDARNLFPAISLAVLLGGYGLRVVLRDRKNSEESSKQFFLEQIEYEELPYVDVLVAARDEENVVERLVERLASIKYPKEKIAFWMIDDGSLDKTAHLFQVAIKNHSNFSLLSRPREAGGGKSGALNHALRQVKGDWIFILDADAQLQEDVLLKLVTFASKGDWSAVQLRKAVINPKQNLLTCLQAMEMAMDAFIQEGRLLGSGVAELRGNGQLIDRKTLERCGGFNEETVTDDLDLSFRLLLSGSSVGILWDPPVEEEAVESLSALFRQRQRWAEGGLQRFFDYWPFLTSWKLNFVIRRDLASFFLLQYAIPVISFVDILTALITQTFPVYWPLSFVALSVSGLAYWRGCRRYSEGPELPEPKPFRLIFSILYLVHWFIVIPLVTIRMALLPKKLVWIKTIHQGN